MDRRWVVRGIVPVLALGLGVAAVFVPVAVIRDHGFATRAVALRTEWQRDIRDGVPAEWITPLRRQLSAYATPSVIGRGWWADQPAGEISSLEHRTALLRQEAMEQARAQLTSELTTARGLPSATDPSTNAAWGAQLRQIEEAAARAATPDALTALVGTLRQAEQDEQGRISRAQLAASGGVAGLTATVHALDAGAAQRNLDAGGMDAALAALSTTAPQGTAGTPPITAVLDAISAVRSAIALNDGLAPELRPLLHRLDEASLLGAPDGAAMQSEYAGVSPAWKAARTQPELQAVQDTVQELTDRSTAAIAAARCGHGSGKSILVSLSLQELIAFQDGCAVQATPVTTGRPALPTPAGHFSVFFKTSPWEMVSSFPYWSPFWYPPTWVSQVMEFASGGYFLHDASWEPVADYGPGGEDNSVSASHGCIHIPTPTMRWLYAWTPVGTPVTVVP